MKLLPGEKPTDVFTPWVEYLEERKWSVFKKWLKHPVEEYKWWHIRRNYPIWGKGW